MTDFNERFDPGSVLTLSGRELKVLSSRPTAGGLIIAFEDIDSRERAIPLRGGYLEVPMEERRRLAEDEFYDFEIIGCDAIMDGLVIGKVEDFLKGAQDTIAIKTIEGKLILVPFVKRFVKKIDVDNGRITFDLIEGMYP